jgi:hypothetical protein
MIFIEASFGVGVAIGIGVESELITPQHPDTSVFSDPDTDSDPDPENEH